MSLCPLHRARPPHCRARDPLEFGNPPDPERNCGITVARHLQIRILPPYTDNQICTYTNIQNLQHVQDGHSASSRTDDFGANRMYLPHTMIAFVFISRQILAVKTAIRPIIAFCTDNTIDVSHVCSLDLCAR